MIYDDASGHIFRRHYPPRKSNNPHHVWCSRCGQLVALRPLPDLEQRRLRKHHAESIIRKNHSESLKSSDADTDSHMVVGRGASGKARRPVNADDIHR